MWKIIVILALLPKETLAQREEALVRWNNLAPFPGAEVRFIAGITGIGRPSTSLFMQLYADSGGRPISVWRWRVDDGSAAGKFAAPDKAGFYWVRAYTSGSDTVVFSLRVRPRNPTYTIRRLPDTMAAKFLKHQMVWLSHDVGGYYLLRIDPRVSYFSAAVRDTGSYTVPQSWAIQRASAGYNRDTGYLTKRFKAISTRPLGREEEIYSIPGDDAFLRPDTKRLDTAAQLTFSGLRLEDSSHIFYMLNHSEEEIVLTEISEKDSIPLFSVPTGYFVDTINRDPTPLPGEKGAKVLDTVYKSAPFGLENIHLHNIYVKGNIYIEAGIDWHQNYDLRKIPPSPWTGNIYDYISRDVHPHFDAALDWFLDGNWIPPYTAMHIDLNTIRYVEFRTGPGVWGYWHPDQPANYGLLFRKTGDDALDVKSAFKHLAIKGYDPAPSINIVQLDGATFVPKIAPVKYYLGRTPPFRLSVLAMIDGQLYGREETIIPD
jgi:hypothetical protein